jgi:hypothetical protein
VLGSSPRWFMTEANYYISTGNERIGIEKREQEKGELH